jgi:hypothetical protein
MTVHDFFLKILVSNSIVFPKRRALPSIAMFIQSKNESILFLIGSKKCDIDGL